MNQNDVQIDLSQVIGAQTIKIAMLEKQVQMLAEENSRLVEEVKRLTDAGTVIDVEKS